MKGLRGLRGHGMRDKKGEERGGRREESCFFDGKFNYSQR